VALLSSNQYKVTEEVLSICAFLHVNESLGGLFYSDTKEERLAESKKTAKVASLEGDLISFVNIYNLYMRKNSSFARSDLLKSLYIREPQFT
jgi:HrpA-like RNA helicase